MKRKNNKEENEGVWGRGRKRVKGELETGTYERTLFCLSTTEQSILYCSKKKSITNTREEKEKDLTNTNTKGQEKGVAMFVSLSPGDL